MARSHAVPWRVLVTLLAVLVASALGASSAEAVTAPTLTGQVTTTATGNAGVAGVQVGIFSGSTEVGSTVTDSNGNYVFNNFTDGDGNYYVEFDGTSAGYSTQWYQDASSETTATAVVVSGSSVTPPTANGSLQPDQVSGTVADLGNAIDGIEVELVNSSHQEIAQTTTNTQGDFSFSPVPPASGDVVEFNPGQANSQYNTTSSNAFQVVAGQTVTVKGELIKEGEIDGRSRTQATKGSRVSTLRSPICRATTWATPPRARTGATRSTDSPPVNTTSSSVHPVARTTSTSGIRAKRSNRRRARSP